MSIGTSSPPAGMRKRPDNPADAGDCQGRDKPTPMDRGEPTCVGTVAPEGPTHSRATIVAMAATITTRRYCMKATSRASAPKAPDISIIAEAPPGAVPHTAVVPGNTFSRVSAQPSAALRPTMASTTLRNNGQPFTKVSTISLVIERASRQPTIVCAANTGRRGARTWPRCRRR